MNKKLRININNINIVYFFYLVYHCPDAIPRHKASEFADEHKECYGNDIANDGYPRE